MKGQLSSVSVIIPVYNDPDGLRTTVNSLLDQTVGNYEVVISDNGSTDSTLDTAQEFAENPRVKLVVEDEIQGSYAARNAGLEAAEGEIIAFLDADMWVDPDYIDAVSRKMAAGEFKYLGCRVEIVDTDGCFGRYNATTGFPVEVYLSEYNFSPTCCLVVEKELFDEIGDFDEELQSGGDSEFGSRVAEAGYEQQYAQDIVLYHPARNSLHGLISKSVRLGRGDEQLTQRYPDRFERRWLLDPRNVLPAHPLRFNKRFRDDAKSICELVCWYLLSYMLKLSSFIGRALEKLNI